MDAKEFLTRLLPQSGHVVIATPETYKNDSGKVIPYYKAHVHTSIDDAITATTNLVWQGKDVFFALSTYKEARVWNAEKQKYQTRTQTNSKALRAFFLDLDIDPAPEGKKVYTTFLSKPIAIAALKDFCKAVGMPKPMVVDSGGGLHVYWPLATEVPTDRWTVAADKFKSICQHLKLPIDPAVPADSARVLRLLGTYNLKKSTAREVKLLSEAHGPYDVSMFETIFDQFITDKGVTALPPRRAGSGRKATPNLAASILGDNIGVTSDPANADRIAFHCGFFGAHVAGHGRGMSEPDWYRACSLGQFSENREYVLEYISKDGKGYDYHATLKKASQWTGPVTCLNIYEDNAAICDQCPHWGKITSPLQLGSVHIESAPPVVSVTLPGEEAPVQVVIPNPPAPYIRYKGTICTETEDADGKQDLKEIVPFDIYPVRIIRQTCSDNDVRELTQWCAHLHRVGDIYLDIPQTILADHRKLQLFLYEKGAYPHSHKNLELQTFMSAYLRELSKQQDREKAYERMGWHGDFTEFVIGESVVHKDGTITKHRLSDSARSATKSSIRAGGTLEDWKKAIQFYNRPGYEGHRMFLYATFAAPLLSFTSYRGLTFSAAGASGKGKSTVLEACASIWGEPQTYVVNGNPDGTTINAMYHKLSVYHNLPFMLDDTTERQPEEMRKYFLNVSQGKDKERMKGNDHDGRNNTWWTIVLTSTNADDVAQVTSIGKESQPHLMRVIPVWFNLVDDSTEAKIEADRFKAEYAVNYGHAGQVFMRAVMPRAEKIKARLIAMIERVDRDIQVQSHERYWTVGVGGAVVGGLLARDLGLLEGFPIEQDYQWMLSHINKMRQTALSHDVVPIDIVNDFLNAALPNTLVVSAKMTSNIDNIAIRPHGALQVRHDFDQGGLYISRSAFSAYCAKNKISFRNIEDRLEKDGIIVARNAQKVLGADTAFATAGQTRCWKIDAVKLGEGYKDAVVSAIASLTKP